MDDENLNFFEFQKRYSSEEACLESISKARWPKGFRCPKCGHDDGYKLSKRRAFQCTSCRRQTSITAGTVFEKTRLPLKHWFWIIFFVAQDKGSGSATRISKLLGMHYATVWFILQKLRVAMAKRDEGIMLSGFIEIDDAFFGGRSKGKTGRGALGKKQVIVMVEREGPYAGNASITAIDKLNYESIKATVGARVEPMQHFRSDGCGSYVGIINMGEGHRLKIGKVPKELQDKELPNVNLVISLAKRYLLGTYHQYCAAPRHHFQRYLDEYCFRFNRRHRWYQLASRLLKTCALHPPIQYAALS